MSVDIWSVRVSYILLSVIVSLCCRVAIYVIVFWVFCLSSIVVVWKPDLNIYCIIAFIQDLYFSQFELAKNKVQSLYDSDASSSEIARWIEWKSTLPH